VDRERQVFRPLNQGVAAAARVLRERVIQGREQRRAEQRLLVEAREETESQQLTRRTVEAVLVVVDLEVYRVQRQIEKEATGRQDKWF
jgi:hypothetical protein